MVKVGASVPLAVGLLLVLLAVVITAGGTYALTVGLSSQTRVRELVADRGAAGVLVFVLGAYGASPPSWPFVLAVGSLVLLALGSWGWLHVVRRHPVCAERT